MSEDNKVLEVANYLNKKPKARALEISKKFGVSRAYAYVLMSKARAIKKEADDVVLEVLVSNPVPTGDLVNHPPHYKVGGIETIDFIEAKQLDYHLGNVVKYISRADHKGSKLENLKKAQWYLNRAIENETTQS
jgi:hypothetical protein